MTSRLRFAEALGNRFLIVDYRHTAPLPPEYWLTFAKQANRPIDQLIEIYPSDSADSRLVFYNQDGSTAEACGNGTRCVALLLYEGQQDQKIWHFETVGGCLRTFIEDQQNIAITFPPPDYNTLPDFPVDLPLLVPPDIITLGNPHLILWLADNEVIDLHSWGPALEYAFPERINISFATYKQTETIYLRVWERGAGATQACGTAACAAHVSAHMHGFVADTSYIQQIGGKLTIHWPGPGHSLTLRGPAELSTDCDY